MLLSHHLAEKGGFTCVVSRRLGKLLGPFYIWQHEMTSNFQLTHRMHKYLLILQRTDTIIIIFTCILHRYHKTLKCLLFTGHKISFNRDMYGWEQEQWFFHFSWLNILIYHLSIHSKSVLIAEQTCSIFHYLGHNVWCVLKYKQWCAMVNEDQNHCYQLFQLHSLSRQWKAFTEIGVI